METTRFGANSLILTALMAVLVLLFDEMAGNATGADGAKLESGLPKVEKVFSVIHHREGIGDADGKTFAAMIPPEDVKRIILLHDHGFDAEQKVRVDPDRLFAEVIKSQVRSTSWGLDALERPVAEFIIIARNGRVFKITALGFVGSPTARVTGVWLFGKGFSRRFDFRAAPLECGTQD